MKFFVVSLALIAHTTFASRLHHMDANCAAQDLKIRASFQNKLARACEEMCKEVGAYPKCQCPDFAEPDSTPGVMTWDELNEYMDKLVDWAGDTIRGWKTTASTLQKSVRTNRTSLRAGERVDAENCVAMDLQHRMRVQNTLAKACEEMCKEVGAYPKCQCPDFAEPDSTPGVMTWDELNEYMDKLVDWAGDTIRGWKTTASTLQKSVRTNRTSLRAGERVDAENCVAMDLQQRMRVQNNLAKACEEMCKEVGAYPKCKCPDFAEPDSTPGVMTWDELNEYMDKLVDWAGDTIRAWKTTASTLQEGAGPRTPRA